MTLLKAAGPVIGNSEWLAEKGSSYALTCTLVWMIIYMNMDIRLGLYTIVNNMLCRSSTRLDMDMYGHGHGHGRAFRRVHRKSPSSPSRRQAVRSQNIGRGKETEAEER